MEEKKCVTCGSTNIYYREAHADTGMDEMEMCCRDYERKSEYCFS